jgi:GTPase SAR1 family protein
LPYARALAQYLLPMQGFILVYSVTSRPSFERLAELYPPICKHKTETKLPHVIVILGNKSDEHIGRQARLDRRSHATTPTQTSNANRPNSLSVSRPLVRAGVV